VDRHGVAEAQRSFSVERSSNGLCLTKHCSNIPIVNN
jgi:hypothetical protein